MHLADRLDLPAGYTARPYAGRSDHATMAALLTAYRRAKGNPEMVNAAQIDQSYANLTDCDPGLDIAMIEHDGEPAAYSRPTFARLANGYTDLVVFTPAHPDHLTRDLWSAAADAGERHLRKWVTDADEHPRYRGYAGHPGPGEAPTGEALWFEDRGYEATEWGASLRRSHLDDIPELPLPDGIELRPVQPDQMRHIVLMHNECFRDEWDFEPAMAEDTSYVLEDPHTDHTLWQVAWHGDLVVSQVKPFINTEENDERGYLRGYTEYISTHADYRNRGLAGALLARSLQALKERGMTEAVLGVDTNNPGGALQLYTKLGFELESYEAVYTKPYGAITG